MTDIQWLDKHTEDLRTKADAVIDSLHALDQADSHHKQAFAALQEAMLTANLYTITRRGHSIGFLDGDDHMSIESLDHADL